MDVELERQRTEPDYTVYIPKGADGATHDTGNEHFLVFDGPDGALAVVWTQSTFEGQPDQRIVFSRSDDEGHTWADPVVVAGATPPEKGHMASWGFPMVSRSGRITVIWNQHTGTNDIFTHTTGLMAGRYSDDAGRTWSEPQTIPMRRSTWDNPDTSFPSNWIVWQRPERLSEGKYYVGFTRWVSPGVRPPAPVNHWTAQASVVEFMRFENIDDDPEPADIAISSFAADDGALQVGFPGHPDCSVVQEPSLVRLPDGRLFVTLRSPTGNPYYSVSADEGRTWRPPAVMRQFDDGPELRHPCSPCPIYDLRDGRYVFLHHNHDGHLGDFGPFDTSDHRRPITVALGRHRPGATQPLWFSEPKLLMDNEGVRIGHGAGRADLAMYASFTVRDGNRVLWYPERKFFLLGKRITDAFLSDMTVPAIGTRT